MVGQQSTTPGPSLSKGGNHAAIFMHGGEPKDREVCARNEITAKYPRQSPDRAAASVISKLRSGAHCDGRHIKAHLSFDCPNGLWTLNCR